jgi:hypothetical protein
MKRRRAGLQPRLGNGPLKVAQASALSLGGRTGLSFDFAQGTLSLPKGEGLSHPLDTSELGFRVHNLAL